MLTIHWLTVVHAYQVMLTTLLNIQVSTNVSPTVLVHSEHWSYPDALDLDGPRRVRSCLSPVTICEIFAFDQIARQSVSTLFSTFPLFRC